MKDIATSHSATSGGNLKPQLSEEACLELGGHCWVQSDIVFATNPSGYERRCKHCGKRQRGHEQPRIAWEDA